MIESEKLQVSELRNQGYSDMQLKELGYSAPSVARAPSVLLKKWMYIERNQQRTNYEINNVLHYV